MAKKVLVVGLDCASPELIFSKFIDDLPNLKALMNRSIYGNLASTTPPITVPAWISMMTSKDPGQLGLYGFRNRKDYSYKQLVVANSLMIKEKTVWDILGEHNRQSILIGVPLTSPPKPVNGIMVSCFLTPDKTCNYVYPDSFKEELEEITDGYMADVEEFRTNDKQKILSDIYEMTKKRFKIVSHCIKNKEWDFLIFVEMGVDRIHHAFWKYYDKDHLKYEAGNPFEDVIHDYYCFVDKEIGLLLSLLDEETSVMVVSDHGVKRMDGAICINDWLKNEKYLTLKESPQVVKRLEPDMINWDKTQIWAEGGYYARIYFNVKGREPSGIVPEENFPVLRSELKDKLNNIPDHNGKLLNNRVFIPEEIYRECNNIAPDLMVYFGNLHWRVAGSVGHKTIWTFDNDTGPDYANHDVNGIFLKNTISGDRSWQRERNNEAEENTPSIENNNTWDTYSIFDVAPTILNELGVPIPEDMIGKII